VLVAIVVVCGIVYRLKFHGDGIVARRGLSIGADLGTLADKARVRVRAVTQEGPEHVRLVLTPERGPVEDPDLVTSSDMDLVVLLSEADFGCGLLQQWQESATVLAIVMPQGSRIVRLRAMDDLQPLTLRLEGG
jgi:hypothetical protein